MLSKMVNTPNPTQTRLALDRARATAGQSNARTAHTRQPKLTRKPNQKLHERYVTFAVDVVLGFAVIPLQSFWKLCTHRGPASGAPVIATFHGACAKPYAGHYNPAVRLRLASQVKGSGENPLAT